MESRYLAVNALIVSELLGDKDSEETRHYGLIVQISRWMRVATSVNN